MADPVTVVRTDTTSSQVETVPTGKEMGKKKVIFRFYQVIWYVLAIVETLLAFRFLFKLLGASQASAFVQFLYQITFLFVYPFVDIFPSPAVAGSVVEWSTVIAMIFYAVVAYGLVYLFQLIKPVDSAEVEQAVDNP